MELPSLKERNGALPPLEGKPLTQEEIMSQARIAREESDASGDEEEKKTTLSQAESGFDFMREQN